MIQWDYQITIHALPQRPSYEGTGRIECGPGGQCFIPYDVSAGGLGWLEDLFREKGKQGWELVQSGYHEKELLCIWKKMKEIKERG